ncbi:MAG: hypothetical protein E7281_01700 [Lachnospiraceae bacterium]|nr:hypothetical protein [Lachnospiraceae bacterium]
MLQVHSDIDYFVINKKIQMKEKRSYEKKPLKDWQFKLIGKNVFMLYWGDHMNGIQYKWEYEEDENQSGTNFYLRKSFNMMYKYIIVGFLDVLAILILLLSLVAGGGYLLLMFLGFAIIPLLLTYMAYLQFGKHAERVLRDFLDAI